MVSYTRFAQALGAVFITFVTAGIAVAATPTVNGCTPDTATDGTGQSTATINFGGALGFNYSPKCLHVNSGTAVTFSGTFGSHPLVGGSVIGTTPTPEADSPFPATSSGSSVTVTLVRQGLFGYYCGFHGAGGMYGAVLVGAETVFAGNFDGP